MSGFEFVMISIAAGLAFAWIAGWTMTLATGMWLALLDRIDTWRMQARIDRRTRRLKKVPR